MSGSPTQTKWRSLLRPDRILAAASVVWVVTVLVAFAAEPIALWLTIGLLALDAVVALTVLIRFKRIAAMLGLTQLVLFTLAHYQVYRALGAEHYAFDHEPDLFGWLQFSGVHVLRGGPVGHHRGIRSRPPEHQTRQHSVGLSAGGDAPDG